MPEAPLKIRQATTDDLSDIVLVIEKASVTNEWLFGHRAAASSDVSIAIEAPNLTLIAIWEFAPAGVALWTRRSSILRLSRLAVVPKWRRKGIATRMLVGSEEHARATGISALEADVADELGISGLFVNLGYRASNREMVFNQPGTSQPYCRVSYRKVVASS